MGTRAQFFIGNPQDLEGRQWLGTIAWDGYPDGDCEVLAEAQTEAAFRDAVQTLAASRDDFCDPAKHGFPFPWVKDLFLTDCTYAFFDGRVQYTSFHRGWVDLATYVKDEAFRESYGERHDELPGNVPSPSKEWDTSGPDSIMTVTATENGNVSIS